MGTVLTGLLKVNWIHFALRVSCGGTGCGFSLKLVLHFVCIWQCCFRRLENCLWERLAWKGFGKVYELAVLIFLFALTNPDVKSISPSLLLLWIELSLPPYFPFHDRLYPLKPWAKMYLCPLKLLQSSNSATVMRKYTLFVRMALVIANRRSILSQF